MDVKLIIVLVLGTFHAKLKILFTGTLTASMFGCILPA